MNKAGAFILALISFTFGLMMLAGIIPTAIDGTLSETFEQNYSVVTGPGTTTAVCVLTYDHYYGDTSNMETESSLITDDPYIMDYQPATKYVYVDGLTVSDTRILTIGYVREKDNSMFFGWSTFVTAIPFLIGLGLIAGLVVAIVRNTREQ